MAAERIKVFEEKSGMPVWAWLIPLLLFLAFVAWYSLRPRQAEVNTAAPATTATAAATGAPDLGAVHFDTDKATLTPEGQATLKRAAAYLNQNPSAHMRVEGYTDSTGAASHNASLSEQRALAVSRFLEGSGVDKSRLTGEGFADRKPIGSNENAAGKADNRRVEVFIEK